MKVRVLKQLSFGKTKTAGRNSAGRITAFHRGGGSKRLERIIDVKRSTPSMGIVERIEYDPNRSSKIALVRTISGECPDVKEKHGTREPFSPPSNLLESTSATLCGRFSFSSLPGRLPNEKRLAFFSSQPSPNLVMVGLPSCTHLEREGGMLRKYACLNDVLISTLSSLKAKKEGSMLSPDGWSRFPRILLAGANPDFFVPIMGDSLSGKTSVSFGELQRRPSLADRIQGKSAIPWQSLGKLGKLGSMEALRMAKKRK